jgi:hypothetical protein
MHQCISAGRLVTSSDMQCFFHGLFYVTISIYTIQNQMAGLLMNDELKNDLEGSSSDLTEVLSGICPDKLRKTIHISQHSQCPSHDSN